ncbi:MAG TPA: hypothetical protein VEA40_08905 [Ramlibacter sp.]|nr:hypothetical protein [Ramlibacter sp.]
MQAGIEVWTAQPDRLGCETCAELAALLDPGERERVAQLRFDADRRAFVVAHALRRFALGMAMAVDPRDLRFGTGPHGQPVVVNAGGELPSFSLTRSRGLVACAVSLVGPVGIDVEPVRDDADPEVLGPYMDAATDTDGAVTFCQQWTALEAFWKARGLGLSAAHPRIRLRPLEDADECFEVVYGDSGRSSGLVVLRLPAPRSHVLTLACREVASVRMVDFERLAAKPRSLDEAPGTTCADRRCERAAASPIEP